MVIGLDCENLARQVTMAMATADTTARTKTKTTRNIHRQRVHLDITSQQLLQRRPAAGGDAAVPRKRPSGRRRGKEGQPMTEATDGDWEGSPDGEGKREGHRERRSDGGREREESRWKTVTVAVTVTFL